MRGKSKPLMFTGIIQGTGKIVSLKPEPLQLSYAVEFPKALLKNLKIGASVAIDGVCQTVVNINQQIVWFDAIQETLYKTNLSMLTLYQAVHIERAAKWGDEIGGHLVSGHVVGTAILQQQQWLSQHYLKVTVSCEPKWMAYILDKGFIALNGASLTVNDPQPTGEFSIHLIPETLAQTSFSHQKIGSLINLELDAQVQTIVETVTRILQL
jgi:riboflavin synthase